MSNCTSFVDGYHNGVISVDKNRVIEILTSEIERTTDCTDPSKRPFTIWDISTARR